jgi:hypothetical protein
MSNAVIVVLILCAALALLLPPLMIGFSRLPRLDNHGDDFGETGKPKPNWPPTADDRVRMKGLQRLLVIWAAAFVLFVIALMLSLQSA